MSDVEGNRTETLTRQQGPDKLSALAAALSEGAGVEVELVRALSRCMFPTRLLTSLRPPGSLWRLRRSLLQQ